MSPPQRKEDDARTQRILELEDHDRRKSIDSKEFTGNIYVIGQSGSSIAKIGYSTDIHKRHKGLQSSHPHLLELLWHTSGDRKLEYALHEKFKKLRVRGEWYDFGDLDPVKSAKKAVKQIRAAATQTRTGSAATTTQDSSES
ncbi:hypothetical protein GCM10009754_36160 [Amycolatopsis minnesotensis]|uniref:Bacteriophage T5 Orf172 DNA-binding domain-containing protein n=2 Tax=Amycolatopsis minnesotensis TaxID=337894 RepID=A0ABP5CCS9_9PSEU